MSPTGLFVAAALFGPPVGDWRVIMTSSDGTATVVDGASIRREGSVLTFWQKDVHPDETIEGARIRLDCAANTWQILYHESTDSKGRVVSTLTKRLKPQEIRPGSAMEEERNRLCRVLVRN